MIIRFFKSSQPASIIFLPMLAIAMWIPAFIKPHEIDFSAAMPLFEEIAHWLIDFPRLAAFIAMLFVISEAFLLNYLVNQHEVLGRQTDLPAFIYIILISCCYPLLKLHPLLISNLFILISLNKLFGTYRQNSAFSQVFDSGFFISIATLFYLPSALYFLVIWVALVALRPFIWREWTIAFTGFAIPIAFAVAYYYLTDDLKLFGYKIEANSTFNFFLSYHLEGGYLILTTTLGILFVFSLLKLLTSMEGNKIKTKRIMLVCIFFMFIAIVTTKFSYQHTIVSFVSVFIPFSIFTSNYFLQIKRSWLAELIFFIVLAGIVITYFLA
jgi:hypothetical protein